MEIEVLLFGTLKDVAGTDRIRVTLPGDAVATVASLQETCAQQHPALARWLPHVKVAVNLEYSARDRVIAQGDEIALLPPVAGGSENLRSQEKITLESQV